MVASTEQAKAGGPAARVSPLAELRHFLQRSAERCRERLVLLGAVRFDTASDIARDAVAHSEAQARAAEEAARLDAAAAGQAAEVEGLLAGVLADGRVDAGEVGQVRSALARARGASRAARRSRELDLQIAEQLKV